MEKAAKPSEALAEKPALAKIKRALKPAELALISALCTVLLVLCVFALLGYAPFGNRSLLYSDAGYQYYDLLLYYKRVFAGEESFFYSLGKSMGGNNYAVFAYYLASPVVLLSLLFKPEDTALCLNVIALVKFALGAATAAYALSERFSDREDGRAPYAVMIAVSYGLSQYMISQTCNVMWLDGAVMLPLVILGTYRIVKGRSGLLLCVSIALSLIFNWYTGIINCMFSAFWLLFEIVLLRSRLIKSALRYAVYMLSGILVSGIILIPVLLILSDRSHGSGQLKELLMPGFIGNPLSLISNYAPGVVSIKGGCSLYAGSLVLFGVMLFFLNKAFDKRTKIVTGVFLLFTAMSLVFRPLVTVFSIFRNVESYWYRYSYTGIFLLCFIAAACFLKGNGFKAYQPLASGAVFAILSVLFTILFQDRIQRFIYAENLNFTYGVFMETVPSVAVSKVVPALIFMAVLFLVLLAKQKIGSDFKAAIVSIALALEMLLTSGLMLHFYSTEQVADTSNYVKNEMQLVEKVRSGDEGGFYRVAQTSGRSAAKTGNPASYNEGLAYGYNAISSFISDPEEEQGEFLAKLGYPFYSQTITVTSSPILPADSLLGVRYVLSEYDCPGMQKITDFEGFKNAYKNPYCLPAAFIAKGVTAKTGEVNPFEYQNQVYSDITGEEVKLYRPAEFTVKEDKKVTEFQILLPEGNYAIYGRVRIVDGDGDGADTDINGVYALTADRFLSPDVFAVPVSSDEPYASVKVFTTFQASAEFYILDLDIFGETIQKIRAKQAQSADIRAGSAKITAEGSADGEKLFISVPYNDSWKVKINGTDTVPETFGGCMTVVTLQKGMNEITMEYRPPYMTAGIISTCLGIVMAALTVFIYSKKTRPAKEK